MPFRFDFNKTLQATALLLRLAGSARTANYMRLIKLLYIADRESLKETGRPITGDRAVAMQRGPVLSHLFDLIKNCDRRSSEWGEFIELDDYHIRLVRDPGNADLCPYEIDKLQAIWDSHRGKDEWDLVHETHEFPEWRKNDPGTSSKPIPLQDILEAVGRGNDFQAIERDAQESAYFDAFFGG